MKIPEEHFENLLIGNNMEARALAEIRASLLPRLISGKLKVND